MRLNTSQLDGDASPSGWMRIVTFARGGGREVRQGETVKEREAAWVK